MAKKSYNINMEFLGMSRKKLQPGDIFVYKNKYKGYGWGRVIKSDAVMTIQNMLLIYIYDVFTDSCTTIPEFRKDNLLIPPQGINRRGWLDGYFKTVAHKPLDQNDILKQHCFKDKIGSSGEIIYRNENGERVVDITDDKKCAWYGVGNHRSLDDKISIALGLPLAPVEEEDKEKIPKRWKDNPSIRFAEK